MSDYPHHPHHQPHQHPPIPAPVEPPTETAPLLGENALAQNGIQRDAEAARNRNNDPNGSTPPESQDGNPEMRKKMHILLPAVAIGLFLVAVDQLLTVAIYAKIGNDLQALNSTSWIATSYFLTLTSFQPLYGTLSDIFGRKACLLFAYTVFGLGCLGCGLARDIVQLCIGRAIAGIGGGGMNAVVSILLSDIVPLQERGIWQGYLNLIFATGTSTGAPLGGLLADSVGWRWSFIAQAPLCVIAWIVVYFVLDLPSPSKDHWLAKVKQIDFFGAFTLILAVIALLVGLDSGSNLGWSHLRTIIPLVLSLPLFGLFLYIEIKIAKYPFAPGHIILDRGLFACYVCNFFCLAAHMATIFYVPLFFQAVLGAGATESGVMLMPGMIANVFASIGSGWVIKKTGKFYWITVVSFGLILVSYVPHYFSILGRSKIGEVIALTITAFGASSAITTTLVGLLANATAKDSAVVIACSYLFRSLGSSIGISTVGAVLQQVLRTQLAERLPDADEAREIEEKVRQNLDFIKDLPPRVVEQVRGSYQMATLGAFGPIVGYVAVALVVSFWIREKSLRR